MEDRRWRSADLIPLVAKGVLDGDKVVSYDVNQSREDGCGIEDRQAE
jgi:hypothetical protein